MPTPWWEDWRNWKDLTLALVALYAAGISTFVALRDRARLRVSATLGWVVRGEAGAIYVVKERSLVDGPATLDSVQLVVSVVNAGRRPITVASLQGLWAKGEKRGFYVKQPTLPLELKEHASVDLRHNDFRQMLDRGVTALFVKDSLGRHWRVRRSNLRALRKQHARMNSEPE